ncbi:hypothetical protein CPB83DRAFT_904089 [Crepidotus variabilis]|uniref:Uncharacterized protein n=1 Tax=Crepidotus variabilis TaxID=179855 RepID=A0A9P6EMP6_9AGAR|nr:hypothetical protein CPB83DRAFT_904089 [Crepidotus variabilis]
MDKPKVQLPFDIWDLVIHLLASGPSAGKSTALSRLGQTCHTLRPLCQRYLFSSVRLRCSAGLWHNKLINILKHSPEVVGYITSLHLDCARPLDGTGCDPTLLYILSRIKRLKHLSLQGYFVKAMTPVLEYLIKLPTLIELTIDYYSTEIPFSLLFHNQNLKILSLLGRRLDMDNQRPHNQLRLREFRSSGLPLSQQVLSSQLDDGTPVMDFSLLERIHLAREDAPYLENILKAGAPCLSEISFTAIDPGVAHGLQAAIPGLKTLRINEGKHKNFCTPIAAIATELEQLSSLLLGRNSIENLFLYFEVEDSDRRSEAWKRLAMNLSKKDAWPALKRVSMKLRGQSRVGWPHRGLQGILDSSFAFLRSAGLLHLEYV